MLSKQSQLANMRRFSRLGLGRGLNLRHKTIACYRMLHRVSDFDGGRKNSWLAERLLAPEEGSAPLIYVG
jgi:hypothetical protein